MYRRIGEDTMLWSDTINPKFWRVNLLIFYICQYGLLYAKFCAQGHRRDWKKTRDLKIWGKHFLCVMMCCCVVMKRFCWLMMWPPRVLHSMKLLNFWNVVSRIFPCGELWLREARKIFFIPPYFTLFLLSPSVILFATAVTNPPPAPPLSSKEDKSRRGDMFYHSVRIEVPWQREGDPLG